MTRKRSLKKRSKKNSRFINRHSYRRTYRRKDKRKNKKTRKKNKRGGGGESSINVHNFTDVLKLTYNTDCFSMIDIKSDKFHISQLMKRAPDNNYLFEGGIKDKDTFNDFFAEFVRKHEDEFDEKIGGVYLPIMEAEILKLTKNGTKCGDFLIDSINKLLLVNSNVSIVDLVAFDYSVDNKLIKLYGDLGFKLTGDDFLGGELEIPEEIKYLKK
jgi:hypothetical protein